MSLWTRYVKKAMQGGLAQAKPILTS